MSYRMRKNTKNGFTLVEAIVGVLIALTVALAIGVSLRNSVKGGRVISARLSTESSARRSLAMLSGELRGAAKAWNGGNVIEAASSTEIIFYANLDSDSATERVRYTYSGGVVSKGIKKYNSATGQYDTAETLSTIASGLTASTSRPFLQYFGNTFNGSESAVSLSAPIDISLVKLVRFTLIPKNTRSLGAPEFYTTQVSLRLLKDNY